MSTAPQGTAAPSDAADTDLDEIEALVADAFSSEPRPLAERLALVEGGDDLGPTIEAVLEIVEATGADVVVTSATVTGDTATAMVTVNVGDAPFAADLPVELVRVDGTWKVARTAACAVLALGSPCPDAPAG